MKIIIAGGGDVGTYLARMLYSGNHDIIVIDTNPEKLEYINIHFDLLTVKGSATSIRTLKEAGVKRSDLFIAITETEETNILAAILAKKLGTKKTIARIDNREYLNTSNRDHFHNLGVDSLIYPEILASKEIINLLKQTGTAKTFEFSGGQLSLFVLRLQENTAIINKTLIEVSADNQSYEYRAVAIHREGKTIIPRGNDRFCPRDLVYIITSQMGILNLMKYSGIKQHNIKNIMIMGGSRIGNKTAYSLEKHFNIKLLEIDKKKCFQLAENLNNTLVVNADGRNIEILKEEGIEKMDAFIAVTGNSETNILSCILAKKLGVKKTIAEIENIQYIDLAESMKIDTIINKKMIAASHIFGFTMNAEVKTVQCLTATDAEVLELVAHKNSKVTKQIVKNTKYPKGSIIGSVIRGKKSFIAKGDTQIIANDKVIIFALPKVIDKVASMFN